jgi:phospholipid transport system substrate-binding protein
MILSRSVSRRAMLFGSMLTAFQASVGEAAQNPREFIYEFWIRAAPFMDAGLTAAQRLDGIRNLFQTFFDATPITEFVLGRNRRIATPQQIRDFFSLYQEYTVQTYGRKLTQLAGARLVLQNTRLLGAEIIVSSTLIAPSGGTYRVDWCAVDRGGRCKISDLVIEGVSMKMTHRDEVAHWIEINGGSFSSALAVLRQQVGLT